MRNIKAVKKTVIESSVSLSREKKAYSFVLLSAGMLSILASRGAGYFDDTVQYITMHIRREPVYPLYLAFFRFFFDSSDQPGVTGQAGLIAGTSQWKLFGVDSYPGIAAIVQVLMNACVMVVTADRICRLLQRRRRFFLLSIPLQLFTQLMTMAASENHLFLAGSLLTESLSVPLFSLFFTECLAVMIAGRRKVCLPSSLEEPSASAFGKKSIVQPAIHALLLSLLLTLIRSQFFGIIPLWALVTAAAVCRSAKSAARSGIPASCAVGHKSSHASLHRSSCSVSRSFFLRVLIILAAAGVALGYYLQGYPRNAAQRLLCNQSGTERIHRRDDPFAAPGGMAAVACRLRNSGTMGFISQYWCGAPISECSRGWPVYICHCPASALP